MTVEELDMIERRLNNVKDKVTDSNKIAFVYVYVLQAKGDLINCS